MITLPSGFIIVGAVMYFAMNGVELIQEEGNFYFPEDVKRTTPLTSKVFEKHNSASSYTYLLSFMHLVHLLVGLIVLIIVTMKSLKKKYTHENFLGVRLGAIYWHFLDALWIYLFLFFVLIH